MLLNELEEDALTELFNLGVGRAAEALSLMMGTEIFLTVPQVLHLGEKDTFGMVTGETDDMVTAVRQKFHGPFGGNAMLVYPEAQSLALVGALLQGETPLELIGQMEQESLLEVGNVILNACLGSLANILQIELLCNLPEYCQCRLPELLPPGMDLSNDKDFLVLYVLFSVSGISPINGHVLLLLNLTSQESLRQELAKIIGDASLSEDAS
ncbi:MAG: chemotaxis protein CheC [Magnetococcales bacterium]|nr:chemotaxis protein CheC [Magnetococcales bacterium]NGZ25984.1 chemotaxis protein CheC [Magnetococcales bacterium]